MFPAGRRVGLEREDRCSMEKSQRANLKKIQPKGQRHYHYRDHSEEDVGPTTTSDKIEKINRTCTDVGPTSSSNTLEKIHRAHELVESLNHQIEQDIDFLKEVHNSLRYRNVEKITKSETKSPKRIISDKRLGASWAKVRPLANHRYHGRYSDNAHKPQCRTVEVRSSSKDGLLRHATGELKQKELTPSKTPPKRLPFEALPSKELPPKGPVRRNPPLEQSTQEELPGTPPPKERFQKKSLPKADPIQKGFMAGKRQQKADSIVKELEEEKPKPKELAQRVTGSCVPCNCNCEKNNCTTESRSQQTTSRIATSEQKKYEKCDKGTEVTHLDAGSPKARNEEKSFEVDEHIFQDYLKFYYLEEKISDQQEAKPLKTNHPKPNRHSDRPPRSSMSKHPSYPVGKRGHKSTDKNRIDIGGTRNDDPVESTKYLLPRRQTGGTNTETHFRKEINMQKYSLTADSEVSDGQIPSIKSTPEAIVDNSHSQPKDTESQKISEDTCYRRHSSAEESNRPYDDRRVDIEPDEYQLKNDSGTGINNNDSQPRSLDHEDDEPSRISATKDDSIHSGSESDAYETARSTYSNKTNSSVSSDDSVWEKYFPKSYPDGSDTSQSSFTTSQACKECSCDSKEDERPMPNICPCMYGIYRELEAYCMNTNPFRNYL